MRPLALPTLAAAELAARDQVYHTTRAIRLRTRAHIVLLAAEQRLLVPQIAVIVRRAAETGRRWLKRYHAEGLAGLADAPRPGAAAKVTPAYQERLLHLVRQRPRSLDLPFCLWTKQRLADVLAEATGLRVSDATVRRALAQAEIGLSRPQHTMTSPDPDYLVKKRRSTQHEQHSVRTLCSPTRTNAP